MAPTCLFASLCVLSSAALPGHSESSTMLQRAKVQAHVASKGETRVDATVASGTTGSELRLLESLATSVVKDGAKIDEATKEELRQLIATELQNSKDQINAAHTADVTAGATVVSNYQTNCLNAFDNSQSQLANSLASTGSTGVKHASHGTCRGQWRIDDHTRETECNELIAFNNGLRASGQAALPVPANRDGFKDWWPKVKALAAQYQTWKGHDDNCIAAENKEDQTLATCNNKQSTFETAICSDKQGGDSGCDAYDNCYALSEGDLASTRTDAEAGASSRKVEWEAILKIECFANLLINAAGEKQADGTDKLTEEKLNECKNLAVDTAHLDIMTTNPSFPGGLPTKKPCDMSPLDAYGGHPCTANFESISYDGYTDITATCQPCSAPLGELVEFEGEGVCSKLTTVSAGTVTFTVNSAWDRGCAAAREFTASDDIKGVAFKCGTRATHLGAGISSGPGRRLNDFDFTVICRGEDQWDFDHTPTVFEPKFPRSLGSRARYYGSNTFNGDWENDVYSVKINSENRVEYALNGEVFHTSTLDVIYPWHFAVAGYRAGSVLKDVNYLTR